MEYIVVDERVVTQEGELRNSINKSSLGDTRVNFPYLVSHITV